MIPETLIGGLSMVAVTWILSRQVRWRVLNKQEVASRIAGEKREDRLLMAQERRWLKLEAKSIVDSLEGAVAAGTKEIERLEKELESGRVS